MVADELAGVSGFEPPEHFALWAALVALLLAALAEQIHARRVERLAALAFGPTRRPAAWARAVPVLRALACAGLAWGLATLFGLEPRHFSTRGTDAGSKSDPHHVLLVLDVSPSMRLVDAGPKKDESRIARARALMESFFQRVPLDEFRVSVVAVYNGAKPVVIDTTDLEVVRNILGDLPMHFAFPSGKTKLFDGLEAAARIAGPWAPRSTTLLVLSDGDTVPATGMPRMPASVSSVIVVGVGDPQTGRFIDGRQSRQDVPTLRQIAARLAGTFHNGNEKQLATSLIAEAAGLSEDDPFTRLTRREYALLSIGLSSALLALLPLALHLFGTRWRPGVPARSASAVSRSGAGGYPSSWSKVG